VAAAVVNRMARRHTAFAFALLALCLTAGSVAGTRSRSVSLRAIRAANPSSSGHPSSGSGSGCTPVDPGVEGVPPSVKCLEQYTIDKGTPKCPKSGMKSSVPREIFSSGDCKKAAKDKVKVNTISPVCVASVGNPKSYKDQPTLHANSKKAKGKDAAPPSRLNPTQALRNAFPAMVNKVWYSQCSSWESFRIDCVGLVARAWNLDPMSAFTTGDLTPLSNKIDCPTMVPGDILNSKPHVMLFHHWVTPGETFIAWQAAATNMGHIETKPSSPIKLPSMLKAYECRRYKFMTTDNASASGAHSGSGS